MKKETLVAVELCNSDYVDYRDLPILINSLGRLAQMSFFNTLSLLHQEQRLSEAPGQWRIYYCKLTKCNFLKFWLRSVQSQLRMKNFVSPPSFFFSSHLLAERREMELGDDCVVCVSVDAISLSSCRLKFFSCLKDIAVFVGNLSLKHALMYPFSLICYYFLLLWICHFWHFNTVFV